LPEVAGLGDAREDQHGRERTDQRVLEQLLALAQVRVDADRLARHVPLRRVHGLRHLFLLHRFDQQFGEQHLQRGLQPEVFGLEVRMRHVL